MLQSLAIWLLVAAFFGAGLFNALGTPATRESFGRWGYPPQWHLLTGGLEMIGAVLIALPQSRDLGLVFGALILAAAAITVIRYREFSHLAPLGIFAVLLILATIASLQGKF